MLPPARSLLCFASLALALIGVASAPACVGEDPSPVGPTTPPTPGGPDGGVATGGCAATEKLCDGRCVSKTDPIFGCGGGTCAPCASTTAANTTASCVNDVCATACAPGFDDCNGNAADGCETKLAADPVNCGKCGNVCGATHALAKPCSEGKCQFTCDADYGNCGADAEGCNKKIVDDDANCGACGRSCLVGGKCTGKQCSVVMLAADSYPTSLAVNAHYVYWVNGTELKRIQDDGKSLFTLSMPISGELGQPQALVTDGTNFVWANYNDDGAAELEFAKYDGISLPSATEIGSVYGTVHGEIALSGTTVIWANVFDGDPVLRTDLKGSPPVSVTVATGEGNSGGLAVDKTHIYWASSDGHIYRQPIDAATPCVVGSSCEVVAAASNPLAVALDDKNVYFTENVADASVKKVAKTGGTVTALAVHQAQPITIATDGLYVYWGNHGFNETAAQSLRRTKVDAATACDANACELVSTVTNPSAIIVDDKAVYWVDNAPKPPTTTGGIYMRAK